MRRFAAIAIAAALLVTPGAAFAQEEDPGTEVPDPNSPASKCRAEQRADPQGFERKYGQGSENHRDGGLRACVEAQRPAEQRGGGEGNGGGSKEAGLKKEAKRACRAERAKIGKDAFRQKYGPSSAKRCVAKRLAGGGSTGYSKEHFYTEAAAACGTEQRDDPAAFNRKYGGEGVPRGDVRGHCVREKTKGTGFDPQASCAAEKQADPDAFAQEWGSDESSAKQEMNSCIAAKGGTNRSDARRQARADCQREQQRDPTAFDRKYGETNGTAEDALSGCIDEKAAAGDEPPASENQPSNGGRPRRPPPSDPGISTASPR